MAGDLQPGDTLAGYRIENLLGRGGMATVYLAEHDRLKRKVALKVLRPDLGATRRSGSASSPSRSAWPPSTTRTSSPCTRLGRLTRSCSSPCATSTPPT